MKLTKQGERYVAISTFAEKDIPKAAGFRWDKDARCWYTVKDSDAAKLAAYADDTCRDSLAALASEQKAVHDTAIEASRATDADIEIPCHEALSYLPYQKAGIAFCKARTGTLIGDEMGLGKTIQAIGVINADESIKRVLVICPASLKLNWKREMEKWLVRTFCIVIAATEYFPSTADIIIVNYDIIGKLRKAIDAQSFDLIVADECHYLKNPKAQRTAAVLGKWDRDPAKKKEAIKASRRIFMTGTPIVNRPIELWPIIHSLDPGTWRNKMYFAERYCAAFQGSHGWDMSGASNLGELQDKLRTTIMVRRLKADVLTELPAKRRQVIEIAANGASGIVAMEQAAYAAHEDSIIEARVAADLALASDNPDDYKTAVENLREASRVAFTELARVRHEVALAKLPKVTEFAHELIDDDPAKKIVIFTHHHDATDALRKEFPGCAVVDGRESLPDRQAAVDRFQSEASCQVFIGSIKAAGVGLTLTASAHVIFAELDWTPGNLSQAEDRCHRIGQRDSVLVQHLVLEGSLDARMAKILVAKQEVIREALDDDIELPETPSATIGDMRPTRKQIEQESIEISEAEVVEIHHKLRLLAAMCDGAQSLDGSGFNKFDARMGRSLAEMPKLTAKQAVIGKRMVHKYRRQLGSEAA